MKFFVSSYISSEQDAEKRLAICRTCDHMNSLKMCGQCGCFMPAKVRLKHTYCPIQQWGAIEDTGEQHSVSAEYYTDVNTD